MNFVLVSVCDTVHLFHGWEAQKSDVLQGRVILVHSLEQHQQRGQQESQRTWGEQGERQLVEAMIPSPAMELVSQLLSHNTSIQVGKQECTRSDQETYRHRAPEGT